MKMDDGCFNVKQAAKLDNEGRLKELRPYELLGNIAGVSAGMVCIDCGSGTGTFTLPMADLVGSQGKVYAIDRSSEMHDHIRKKNLPTNVILVESDVMQTGLDSQIADVCLLAFILHEVKQPAMLMAESIRLLKPGGKAVVVEWRADSLLRGPPPGKRIAKNKIEEMLEKAGLSQFEYHEWSANHYVAIAKHIKALP